LFKIALIHINSPHRDLKQKVFVKASHSNWVVDVKMLTTFNEQETFI